MSPYNTNRRKHSFSFYIVRLLLIAVGVAALVLLARYVVKSNAEAIIPLYPDSFETSLMSRRQLTTKLYELQGTLDGYNSHIAGMTLLQSENEAFKREFGRDPASRGILAHVLTPPNRSFYDTFVIDAGSVQGIRVDQRVYAFDAVALGVVSEVSDHSAIVRLFSAPGLETSGTAVGSDVAVTLIGRGGGEYEVRMPRDVHFEIGSAIALQSVYPAVLAEVQKIITDPRDPFQRLLAKAPVNLTALKWVVIR